MPEDTDRLIEMTAGYLSTGISVDEIRESLVSHGLAAGEVFLILKAAEILANPAPEDWKSWEKD